MKLFIRRKKTIDRKVVLITGGAMGQGKAHAIRFAENGFSHCESGGYRTDAKTLDMTERKECQRRCNNKTAYVECYLYLWAAYFGYLGKFPREKVGRSYRQTAAVRERYSDADKNRQPRLLGRMFIQALRRSSSSPKTNPTTKLKR